MGISLSGYASGIPTDQIISQLLAIQQRPIDIMMQQKSILQNKVSLYNRIETKVSSLKTMIDTLTDDTFSSPDLFTRKTATSGDESIVTASVTNAAAAPQSITVQVSAKATATQANSNATVGNVITGADLVEDIYPGSITSGDFTVYRNGTAYTVTVDPTTNTITDVLNNISTATGGTVTGTVDGSGNIVLSYADGDAVSLGSSSDTTNFLNVSFLSTGTVNDIVGPTTTLTTSRTLTSIDLNQTITTAAANTGTLVTAGTFTIGTASFDTTGKTLNELISEINSTAGSGVTASYDSANNKMKLVSKSTGSTYITMSDGTSNFLTAMGLVVGGNSTTAQTKGANSTFLINGSTFNSTSNAVGPDVTGISGLTLNLVSASPGTDVTIDITQNTEDLKTAVQNFITAYNNVITQIDTDTNAQSGNLAGASNLIFFRNSLRHTATNRVTGLTYYDNLASIGISTGPVTGTSGTVSPLLQLNATTLDAALANNAGEVQTLMTGASGIITQLQTLVDDALEDNTDPLQDGLFAAYDNSAQARIDRLDDDIAEGERRLTIREQIMRRQYAAMETAISQLKGQGTAITALNSQLSANSGS